MASPAKVPAGMSMLLKSFGIDPAEIIATVPKVATAVKEIAEALGRIEASQTKILSELAELKGKANAGTGK